MTGMAMPDGVHVGGEVYLCSHWMYLPSKPCESQENDTSDNNCNISDVSVAVCYNTKCGYHKMGRCRSGNREKCSGLQTER